MSAEFLSLLAGSVLSLLFSYVPGLNVWFAKQDPTHKRVIMLGLLLAVSAAVFGIGCTSWGPAWGINITCDQVGLQALVGSFFLALIANQGTYSISVEAQAVREAKLAK